MHVLGLESLRYTESEILEGGPSNLFLPSPPDDSDKLSSEHAPVQSYTPFQCGSGSLPGFLAPYLQRTAAARKQFALTPTLRISSQMFSVVFVALLGLALIRLRGR